MSTFQPEDRAFDDDQHRILTGVLRMRWFVVGLLLAALGFALAIEWTLKWPDPKMKTTSLTWLGAMTGLAFYALSFVFAKIATPDLSQTAALLVTRHRSQVIPNTVILDSIANNLKLSKYLQCLILTSGVFLNLVTFYLDKGVLAIAVVALGLLLLISQVPTKRSITKRFMKGLDAVNRELPLIDIQPKSK